MELQLVPRFESHTAECADCALWREQLSRVDGVLGSLDRLVSPAELEECVLEDLALGSGALPGVLSGLSRLEAPLELELRVGALFADIEVDVSVPTWAPIVAGLERHMAPRVLDRLVDEELRDLPAAVTRRQMRNLFRMGTPQDLFGRVSSDLQAQSRPTSRHKWLPMGGLVAAVLLVWASAPSFVQGGRTPQPRFRVVETQSLASLDPLARSLVDGLSGGRVQAVNSTRGIQDGGGQR